MYCENCGKNYANVRYTQIINGNKKELILCEDCSKIFGIDNFNIPIDFSTFLGDFFTDFGEDIPSIFNQKELRCKRCNSTFEDFVKTGRFGCDDCYSTFEEKIDPLLKSLQGSNRHIGRIGKINSEKDEKSEKEKIKDTTKLGQINELSRQLKVAIQEEKYEEAAKIRDKIKEIEGEK